MNTINTGRQKALKRTLPMLWGFLLLLVATASCSHGNVKKQTLDAAKEQSPDLVIGLMPVTDCLPFYVAGYNHTFTKNGVRVRIKTFASSLKCEDAFIKGEIDGAYLTIPQMLYVDNRGVGLKAVMGLPGEMTVVTNHTRRIKKLSSMGGRTIALSRHDTSEFLVDDIAEITKIKRFELLRPQINDIFTRSRMLADNQVDAAVLPSPHDWVSIRNGNVRVLSTNNAKIHFGSVCFHDSVVKGKSEKIRALIKSYSVAATKINSSNASADSVLIKIYRLEPAMLDSIKLPKFEKLQSVDSKDFVRAAEWGRKDGFINRVPEIEDLVSRKFTRE